MPLREAGGIVYLTFDSFEAHGLPHGVVGRHGGVSPAPWASLNLGGTVGDEPDRVAENRRRAFDALGRSLASAFDVWQVHSAEVVVASEPRGSRPIVQADAILTRRPEVTLFMRFADCVPVLLYDPAHQAVGLVHAGWLGTVRQTLPAAIRRMRESFGTRPADLVAGIGPSIGPDHYAVRDDVVSQIRASLGPSAEQHLVARDGRIHLDLWSASRALLEAEGVGQIEAAGICTACQVEDWFSHRAEAGKTGRFGALLALGKGAGVG
jgi:YfiH family protein